MAFVDQSLDFMYGREKEKKSKDAFGETILTAAVILENGFIMLAPGHHHCGSSMAAFLVKHRAG